MRIGRRAYLRQFSIISMLGMRFPITRLPFVRQASEILYITNILITCKDS